MCVRMQLLVTSLPTYNVHSSTMYVLCTEGAYNKWKIVPQNVKCGIQYLTQITEKFLFVFSAMVKYSVYTYYYVLSIVYRTGKLRTYYWCIYLFQTTYMYSLSFIPDQSSINTGMQISWPLMNTEHIRFVSQVTSNNPGNHLNKSKLLNYLKVQTLTSYMTCCQQKESKLIPVLRIHY